MTPDDQALTARVARRLTVAVDAATMEETDDRIYELCAWAQRSPRRTNAMFAAVQMLRDLETIDRAEAAYLFASLCDDLSWRRAPKKERDELAKAVTEGVEYELIVAAMRDKETAREEAF